VKLLGQTFGFRRVFIESGGGQAEKLVAVKLTEVPMAWAGFLKAAKVHVDGCLSILEKGCSKSGLENDAGCI
jgi:hypothetical protein